MTNETTPRHIWMSEVESEALRLSPGCDAELFRDVDVRCKLNRWYDAGEPVWMAASGLRDMVRAISIEHRAQSDARVIRSAWKGAVKS